MMTIQDNEQNNSIKTSPSRPRNSSPQRMSPPSITKTKKVQKKKEKKAFPPPLPLPFPIHFHYIHHTTQTPNHSTNKKPPPPPSTKPAYLPIHNSPFPFPTLSSPLLNPQRRRHMRIGPKGPKSIIEIENQDFGHGEVVGEGF